MYHPSRDLKVFCIAIVVLLIWKMEQHNGPGIAYTLDCFLLDYGWSWGEDMLTKFTEWLADQGIKEGIDMVGLEISDLRRVEQWPSEARIGHAHPPLF